MNPPITQAKLSTIAKMRKGMAPINKTIAKRKEVSIKRIHPRGILKIIVIMNFEAKMIMRNLYEQSWELSCSWFLLRRKKKEMWIFKKSVTENDSTNTLGLNLKS